MTLIKKIASASIKQLTSNYFEILLRHSTSSIGRLMSNLKSFEIVFDKFRIEKKLILICFVRLDVLEALLSATVEFIDCFSFKLLYPFCVMFVCIIYNDAKRYFRTFQVFLLKREPHLTLFIKDCVRSNVQSNVCLDLRLLKFSSEVLGHQIEIFQFNFQNFPNFSKLSKRFQNDSFRFSKPLRQH